MKQNDVKIDEAIRADNPVLAEVLIKKRMEIELENNDKKDNISENKSNNLTILIDNLFLKEIDDV